jgi:ATP-dependent Clp protease ATP-binding subunit ClpA
MIEQNLQEVLNSAFAIAFDRGDASTTIDHVVAALARSGKIRARNSDAAATVNSWASDFAALRNFGGGGTSRLPEASEELMRIIGAVLDEARRGGREAAGIPNFLRTAEASSEASDSWKFLSELSMAETHSAPQGEASRESEEEDRETEDMGERQTPGFLRLLKADKDFEAPYVSDGNLIEQAVETLVSRMVRNFVVVGDPGVGKTSFVRALARHIAEGSVPPALKGARIYIMDVTQLMADTSKMGEIEGKVAKLQEFLASDQKAILFIDDFHTIEGAGTHTKSDVDVIDMLQQSISSGVVRMIGATTPEAFRRMQVRKSGLSRRFRTLELAEPGKESVMDILLAHAPKYEKHYRVTFGADVLEAARALSDKYILGLRQPVKSLSVIDQVGASLTLGNPNGDASDVATEDDVRRIVARIARVPVESISESESEMLERLGVNLKAQVFGQDRAVDLVVRAVRRARVGLNPIHKPVGCFLFAGPTGVGKTELSKRLAEGLGIPLLRYDMSEFKENHSVARLIGASPGYAGHKDGGGLVAAVQKTPHCVLLLDEIEKAHPDIHDILLQVMDYATLTDSAEAKADFSNVVLIMTTNAGADLAGIKTLGFSKNDGSARKNMGRCGVELAFTPEFRNRLTAVVDFEPLSSEVMTLVARKELEKLAEMSAAAGLPVEFGDEAVSRLAEKGFDPLMGARPLARVVTDEIADKLAETILFAKPKKGDKARIVPTDNEFQVLIDGR